jgi:predicted tellurium resistance membrane protein TerC
MSWITSPEAWLGPLTLTVLEIVLGIDNIMPGPGYARSAFCS